MLFLLVLGDFWCLLVTLVTLRINLSNFEKKIQKNPIKSKKKQKSQKIQNKKSSHFFLNKKLEEKNIKNVKQIKILQKLNFFQKNIFFYSKNLKILN